MQSHQMARDFNRLGERQGEFKRFSIAPNLFRRLIKAGKCDESDDSKGKYHPMQ